MSVTYPLALPTVSGLARITMRERNIVAVAASPYTGEQQVYEHPGKWWEADLQWPPLDEDDAAEVGAFLSKLNGPRGTFLMGDPTKETARGAATGAVTINGAHAARVTSLSLSTGVLNQANWLKADDHLQIGSGSAARLHKNLSDANTDASGNVTIDIWPPTRAALAGGESVTLAAPKGVFRLVDMVTESHREPGVFTNYSIKVIEVV